MSLLGAVCAALALAAPASSGGESVIEAFLHRIGVLHAVPQSAGTAPVTLTAARQDWKRLTRDRACHTLTPLRIGTKTYARGLGAHANGRAVFALAAPFRRFRSDVGVDNNADTGGARGSVQFVVRANGREVYRSPVCRGGEEPRAIDVDIAGVSELELVVTDAGDGYSYDQADWAGARVIDARGRTCHLGEFVNAGAAPLFLAQERLPASFTYDGQPSQQLLAAWPREDRPATRAGARTVRETVWREPGGGLEATWRVETFDGADAFEARWSFRNGGAAPTRTLANIRALDLDAALPAAAGTLVSSSGGLIGGMTDPDLGFELRSAPLGTASLSGAGGRSSNRDLPFFLVHADDAAGGIYVGVGWSGQWQADLTRPSEGMLNVAVTVPGTALRLPPGETLRTPSVLVGLYRGDTLDGGNALRRTLRRHYLPDLGGKPAVAPVSWSSWFVFDNRIGQAMLEGQADLAARMGIEWFCIDSGWFDGDFPQGVGNWTLNAAKFPRGLGAIGSYVRERGMQLGLWFEPERVAAGTRLAREHPEWVTGDLLDLGNPDALEWVYAMMCRWIDEGGVRWIRFDFNTEPLPAWDRKDTPETRGLAQARHIAGLYSLLDRLRSAYPDLLIEGCASGGRRIDLETVRRSHTFWKSDDTARLPVMRFHETGGNRLLPGSLLNANLLTVGSAADVLSLFGGPLGFGCDWTQVPQGRLGEVRRLIATYKGVRPLLDADYYPIVTQSRSADAWVGWQFHDPGTGEGFLVVLRPAGSPYSGLDVRLSGIDDDAVYTLRTFGRRGTAARPGRDLARGFRVDLDAEGAGTLVRYAPARRAGGARP